MHNKLKIRTENADKLIKECDDFFSNFDSKCNGIVNKLNFKCDFLVSNINVLVNVKEQLVKAQDKIVTNIHKQRKSVLSKFNRNLEVLSVSILKFIPSKKIGSQNVLKYLFDQMTGQVYQ
jgi:hypothetical protein